MEKIDLVYLYVDSNDSEWLNKKNSYQPKSDVDSVAMHECRFKSYDELKYSLRSVEKYAPWINHVYIVSDNQVPEWLDLSNEKVSIVDHKDIMPQDALPTFNSLSIESCIQNIEGLSECFLYANDDMYFSDYVEPGFFYKKDGYPICRFKRSGKSYTGLYKSLLKNASDIIFEKFGKRYDYMPHHSIDAYRKSTWIECQNTFPESIKQMVYSRFRNDKNCERVLYLYYALALKQGHYKLVKKIDEYLPLYKKILNFIFKKYKRDSLLMLVENIKSASDFAKHKPYLLCINDTIYSTDEDRLKMVEFLEKLYPAKSKFEK